ncbi:MAG: hypothetical protein EZS28_022641 [Streblomastix strix]|uniref:Uncharacterized protein n=1 Tax=Streblomastix strix TaxID=222440 RepID=A0A5J4VHB8_9EUKA|nr:MAG: hypothetical protein EZS28_022641 [Streblomastix strix]
MFTSGKPLTHSSFIGYVFNEYVYVIGRGFVNSFLSRQNDQITLKWCRPGDHGRMEVIRDEVQRYTHDLEVHFVDKLTSAILASYESGCYDWLDAHAQLMLMSANAIPGQLTYQVKLTLDTDVLATGLRLNEDVVIVHGAKGYVNTRIINARATDVVVPFVDSLQPLKLVAQVEAINCLIILQLTRKKNLCRYQPKRTSDRFTFHLILRMHFNATNYIGGRIDRGGNNTVAKPLILSMSKDCFKSCTLAS